MPRLIALFAVLAWVPSLRADDRETARRLESLGGKVTLDKEGTATAVSFAKSDGLGADEYKLIGTLAGLKSLTLYGQCDKLDDKTVPLLKGLAALESLSTDRLMLSDDGYRHLAELKSLKSLALFHVGYKLDGYTGAGYAKLAPLPGLTTLTFAGNTTGDAAVEAAAGLPELRSLRVWHTWATPASVEHIARMPKLTSLRWGQSLPRYDGKPRVLALTPAAVASIAKGAGLEVVELDEARLTFDDLKPLAGLSKLKRLKLERIDIPAADVDRLKGLLKGVEVEWKPLTDDERKKLDTFLGPPTKG